MYNDKYKNKIIVTPRIKESYKIKVKITTTNGINNKGSTTVKYYNKR